MKNLIIIGAGGMGRAFYNIAMGCHGFGTDFVIKGFLDDDMSQLDGFEGYPPILGTIGEYEIQPYDAFTCSIGDVPSKVLCCEKILQKGGVFMTLIHQQAIVHKNVKFGDGCVVAPLCFVDCDTTVGSNCLLQTDAVIGHDCTIGDFVRIDTHVTCVGGVKIGNRATIHTSAVLNHKVVVEDDATVGACSFVIRKVKKGSTVWGNPARTLKY